MEFFKHGTKIDFMGARRWTAILSILLFTISIGALIVNGLRFGLDFTGGMQIEVHYSKPANIEQIRSQLIKANLKEAVVQTYGTSEQVLISIPANIIAKGQEQQIVEKIMSALPGGEKQRVDAIGAQVGRELTTRGLLAVFVALLATMIYIALRFEYRFAVSSTVALIHDPVLILGIFALFQIEFDLKALAALLAIIGYSLNDTIVVFDRVRENFKKMRKSTPLEIMNVSINQTLSRTIMTSALTLVVVVVLFIYGGEMIRGFSLALIIGIVIGTYSSIYVAGALALKMGLSREDLLPKQKKVVDDRP